MTRRRSPDLAAVAAKEVAATVRSAMWPLARLRPLPEPAPVDGLVPVVCVHGFLGHAGMMRPLARRLLSEGWPHVERLNYPSYRLGLEDIVDRIAACVKSFDGPVDLVGHSLGAFASRTYLKAFDGHRHVRRFVSLGGPHAGTHWYRLVPPWLQDALNPDGPWVRRCDDGPEPVPTTVIRAAYDHQVFPPERACIRGATELVLSRYGHNGLLWAPEAHDAVVEALR